MRRVSLRFAPLWGILVSLVACGGGNGGEDPAASQNVVFGQITAFGSIFVSEIEFELEGASIRLEDSLGGEDDLRIGMMVRIRGRIHDDGTGTASSVEYKDNLEGPISQINLIGGTFTVLGQTIIVNAQTRFDDVANLAALAVGNMVEVSGLPDADGNVVATYVEFKGVAFDPDEDEIEIKGTVSDLDTGAQTFKLGALTVDYSDAELDDLPAGGLANDLFVEVKSTQLPVGNTLIASEVEQESEFGEIEAEHGAEVEIEGFVTDFTSASEFKVNGHPVRTTAQTSYEGGTALNIALNVKLEVEGTVNQEGILIASEIDFED